MPIGCPNKTKLRSYISPSKHTLSLAYTLLKHVGSLLIKQMMGMSNNMIIQKDWVLGARVDDQGLLQCIIL